MMYDSPAERNGTARLGEGPYTFESRHEIGGRWGDESVISFSGSSRGKERRRGVRVAPTVVPKYGKINKLLKLKSRPFSTASAPLPPPSAQAPSPPVSLSAGIKDPHKFHSARPSTLARAKTRKRRYPSSPKKECCASKRAASRRAGSGYSSLRNFERRRSGITFSLSLSIPALFLPSSILCHDPPRRSLFLSRHGETPEIYARLISAIT